MTLHYNKPAESEIPTDDILSLAPDWKRLMNQLDEPVLHVDFFDAVTALTASAAQLVSSTTAVKLTLDQLAVILCPGIVGYVQKARRQPGKKICTFLSDLRGRFLEITVCSVIADRGVSLGVFILFHDLTEYRARQEKISSFVSMVAHELLNPMAPIMEGLNLLNDPQVGSLNDVQRHCLAVVAEETNRLARLVNDLLDISRFDCGKIKIQRIPVDVPKLLSSAVNNVNARAIAKRIKLEINYSDMTDDLYGDADRLRQVIINLLDNSIKYSLPERTVQLSILTKKDHIDISVKDQGFGMNRRDIPRLFDRFTQLNYPDHIRSRGHGSGLGLALVQEIVKLHKGKIRVNTEVNEGSEFIISLPKRRKGRPS